MSKPDVTTENGQFYCKTPLDDCVVTRRCFMTGEYCSQQYNIQRERNELHHKAQISAFVVMGFSDMADVVYKWRIKPFIESLTKYLRINKKSNTLYCFTNNDKDPVSEDSLDGDEWEKVKKINVVRADSDPASNYVICNRMCQQLQIADLIIVDFSSQNPNVMYEFGMAVALNKLILPICFSESFYHRVPPKGKTPSIAADKHIGYYPWRKMLFEHYGILFRQENPSTEYVDYQTATDKENGFDDMLYARFPYAEHIDGSDTSIGKKIYCKLQDIYNNSTPKSNTLVVYTMEGFLNENEAASCICTFNKNITSRMRTEQCFCGDRVGVLVQAQAVYEEDKDALQREIPYNIGEIIRIGVNQATYLAEDKKVRPDDMLSTNDSLLGITWRRSLSNDRFSPNDREKEIVRFIKDHISNRGMIIYPNHPVYVERIKKGLQPDLFSANGEQQRDAFCLFHVMLLNLRYVNEVVVDISNNALLGLFWLGAAHGSDINAITVRHDPHPLQRRQIQAPRNIFDVSGLWTALYHSHDTDGFYRQLALVQAGIERHSKLMLSSVDSINEELKELFHHSIDFSRKLNYLHQQYAQQANDVLESYYRNTFWKPILCYNKLRIYVGQVAEKATSDSQTHLRVAQWDFDAVSTLTHYLSKHTPIGEYVVIASTKENISAANSQVNSLYIGNAEQFASKVWLEPLAQKIAKWEKVPCLNNVPNLNTLHSFSSNMESCVKKCSSVNRGFSAGESETEKYFTRHTDTTCLDCDKNRTCFTSENTNISEHDQLAQLVLWRDEQAAEEGDEREEDHSETEVQPSHFKVAIIGSSGPSTFGLSSLFVDKKHKLYRHDETRDESPNGAIDDDNLLCDLQMIIRDRFMHIYLCLFTKQWDDWIANGIGSISADVCEKIRNAVVYCVCAYLSTTLYKFFLPFYTLQEQKQILNSVHTYFNAMRTACVFPFNEESSEYKDLYQKIENSVLDVLEVTLSAFRGIEVFYRITVDHNISPKPSSVASDNVIDTRYAKAITIAKKGDPSLVRDHIFPETDNAQDEEGRSPLAYCFFDTKLLHDKTMLLCSTRNKYDIGPNS